MTITDILENNIIVLGDPETGVLFTANGSYIQVWENLGDGTYSCEDCTPLDSDNGLYGVTGAELIDQVEQASRRWGYDC